MTEEWDCIVVGAGIMGSWSAYHLAKQGSKTLLLEQFALPHTRGSSHGQSRIIRMAYDKEHYAAMMPEAYDWWHKLEKESGKKLLVKTGLVKVQGGGKETLKKSYQTMKKLNLDPEWLDGEELRAQYPQFKYPLEHSAVVDKSAGLLLPSRCLLVLQRLFEEAGGSIEDGSAVVSIQPGSSIVVTTSKAVYRTKRLIITAGPWAKDLLNKVGVEVPVKTMEGRGAYWADFSSGRYDAAVGTPIWLHHLEPPLIPQGYRFYALFPELEFPGMVKIVTRGEPPPRYSHPDVRDRDDVGEMMQLVSDYVTKHFPDVDNKPSIIEPCVYSMTPDSNYIIDYHPKHRNIVFGCGFSGHGFKTAPVVGKLLVEMVHGQKPSHDVSHYKVSKYYNKSKL